MRKKIGFLKSATAAADGYYSKKGEKLVSGRLTKAEVEEFNGKKKKIPVAAVAAAKKVAAKVEAPTIVEVEAVVEQAAAEVFASIAETEKTE